MGSHRCSYCDRNLFVGEMDVDHYLPCHEFRLLTYQWDNLLPACSYCNQRRKGKFFPKSLLGRKLVGAAYIKEFPEGEVYDKVHHLGEIAASDRLIDPSFDNPEDHLEFNPEFLYYKAKTPIGALTIQRFFSSKEVAEKWSETSEYIRSLVESEARADIIEDFIEIHGYAHVCRAFLTYWQKEKAEGRLHLRPAIQGHGQGQPPAIG